MSTETKFTHVFNEIIAAIDNGPGITISLDWDDNTGSWDGELCIGDDRLSGEFMLRVEAWERAATYYQPRESGELEFDFFCKPETLEFWDNDSISCYTPELTPEQFDCLENTIKSKITYL